MHKEMIRTELLDPVVLQRGFYEIELPAGTEVTVQSGFVSRLPEADGGYMARNLYEATSKSIIKMARVATPGKAY